MWLPKQKNNLSEGCRFGTNTSLFDSIEQCSFGGLQRAIISVFMCKLSALMTGEGGWNLGFSLRIRCRSFYFLWRSTHLLTSELAKLLEDIKADFLVERQLILTVTQPKPSKWTSASPGRRIWFLRNLTRMNSGKHRIRFMFLCFFSRCGRGH